jgi:hypothetical protein
MSISTLYPGYFQKSKSFLFPALGIKKGPFTTPLQSYISWDDYILQSDKKLVCLYDTTDPRHKTISEPIMFSHSLFERAKRLSMSQCLYIFDMSRYSDEFEFFLRGKYSQFSQPVKESIKNYFGPSSLEYAYMETFLYPEQFFDLYANLLDVNPFHLQQVGQLCNAYNPEKENFSFVRTNSEMALA